jgi:hypothetical protein
MNALGLRIAAGSLNRSNPAAESSSLVVVVVRPLAERQKRRELERVDEPVGPGREDVAKPAVVVCPVWLDLGTGDRRSRQRARKRCRQREAPSHAA